MDFKNLNTILYKFSSQFKIGNPNVVNSVVMNLDYIIVNFPYFKDINIILEFILTDNRELRFVLKDHVPMIFRLLKYKKDWNKYKINRMKKDSSVDPNLSTPTPLSTPTKFNTPTKVNTLLGTPTPLSTPTKFNTPTSLSTPTKFNTPTPLNTPTKIKPKFKQIVFDDLDDVSKNKVVLWKGVLKGLTLKKFYNSWIVMEEDENVFFTSTHLNEELNVYDGVFKILSYHYELLRDKILIELNSEYLEKILRFIELESSQDLLNRLLDKKMNSTLFPILRLLEEVGACKYLLNYKKYYELLEYLEIMMNTRGVNDSQSTDEESNVWDELYTLRDTLLEIFIKEEKINIWKPVCSILEILYKIKPDGEIKVCESSDLKDSDLKDRDLKDSDLKSTDLGGDPDGKDASVISDGSDASVISDGKDKDIQSALSKMNINPFPQLSPLKTKFYVRLLCTPLSYTLPHIYKSGLHSTFVRLFFDNPQDSFYGKALFGFFKASLKKSEYFNSLKEAGFIEGLKNVILRNVAESYGGRPKTDGIYPFALQLCVNHKLQDFMTKDGDFLTVYKISERIVEADSLTYNDDFRIDEYLDNCLNDIIVRYACNIVIDRMPVLSAFLSKDHHPESTVEYAESKEEKRIRIGGGMQDTL